MINLEQPITEYLMRERVSESGKLWPSAIGGCVRAELARYLGLRPSHPFPLEKQWMFQRFKWYEGIFYDALAAEVKLHNGALGQVNVENEWWHGKIDLVIDDSLIELKSISPWATLTEPYHHHKLQIWVYWILGASLKFEQAQLTYIQRWNDGEVPKITSFDVTPVGDDLAEVTTMMDRFEQYAKDRELPHAPFTSPTEHEWLCTRTKYNKKEKRQEISIECPYFSHCWPGYVGDDHMFCEEF